MKLAHLTLLGQGAAVSLKTLKWQQFEILIQ